MRQDEYIGEGIFGKRLTSLANGTVRIVGVIIFAYLTWYSMCYTQYVNPLGEEISVNVLDSVKRNLLFLVMAIAAIVGLAMLETRLAEKTRIWIARVSITFVSVWIGCWSFWWITAADRQPVGDQAFIYGGASYFIEGNYVFLDAGGYCTIYPHQLGLIALVELLFRLVGTYNYFAYQFICAELAVGVVLVGYALLRQITDNMTVSLSYCAFMLFCVPLVFYTSWVYGEIPCVFFSLLTAYCLIKYDKTGQKRCLIGMVLSVIMAVLVRKNSLIMLIAVCLVGGVYMLCRRDKRLLLALVAAAVLPSLVYQGIFKVYEICSGYPHMDGVEPISYVVMGMQENNGMYGWFNNYNKMLYYEVKLDNDLMKEVCEEDLRMRLEEFRNDPSYAVHFFREKILSQWNMPLYQSLYFNSQYTEGKIPPADSFVSKLNDRYFVPVLGIADRMQFILYFGMICYFLFAVTKKSNILHHMLAVTIIGGFLFSIIWEAMGRYVFPYYMTMYPLAAIGYWQAITQVKALLGRKQKSKRENNVIPFERVA